MRSYETIAVNIDARGVATVTLARPEKHNALNATMIAELHSVANELGSDRNVRVVVLTGQGKVFCAGGDLRWMQEQMAADRAGRINQANAIASMLEALDTTPKPLIARVQGPAYGGGVGLICVCDITVVVENAVFTLAETRLGLIPATIGPYVLRRIGEAGARAQMLNSRPFDPARAQALGLATSVVASSVLDEAIETEIGHFLNCAPGAVADAKAMIQHLARTACKDQKAWSVEQLADRWETDEAREGIAAFFKKKPPPWSGSD